ncbi:MAG: response regulator [Chloroflexi bacterium]|nr:response regulator [Chloroflexota bacterium]MBU1750877.1 response regulator [Chloroflexota bacterium]
MAKERLLIVEDEPQVQRLLQIYFTNAGYEVVRAFTGQSALEACVGRPPKLAILDINLPDMDGYDVCRALRENPRSRHIPIIFLTQRDERSSKIAGLELGAVDYIIKPFDMKELHLRVENALRCANRENLANPVTGLPGPRLLEEEYHQRFEGRHRWAALYTTINHFKKFNDYYGFVAADDLIEFLGIALASVVNEAGNREDFIGHLSTDNFVIVTTPDKVKSICERAIARFEREIRLFYPFKDRQVGGMDMEEVVQIRDAPLAFLSIGAVTIGGRRSQISTVRDLNEALGNARSKAQALGKSGYVTESA